MRTIIFVTFIALSVATFMGKNQSASIDFHSTQSEALLKPNSWHQGEKNQLLVDMVLWKTPDTGKLQAHSERQIVKDSIISGLKRLETNREQQKNAP